MDRSVKDHADVVRQSEPAQGDAVRQSPSNPHEGDPVFNYEDSLARLGGDRQLFGEILDIFLEDSPAFLRQAMDSLAAGDAPRLERAAHTLKGLSSNFAAASTVAAAYAVELHARERKLDQAGKCIGQLQSELARLEAALRAFREKGLPT
jgi:HPt (histidine-containing phosphotransfer) domain-containing protein